MAHIVTDATFEAETNEGLVLVDFWATWCGPCLMQAPILDQLSEEIDEDVLKIVKIDVDENPNTAQEFGIMSIPTLLFKKRSEEHTSELQSRFDLVCRLLLEQKKHITSKQQH